MLHSIQLSCPLHDSFRVQQVAGMFDVPLAETLREEISIDVPSLDFDWRIGVVIGPSGSGKTTLARQLFGENFIERVDWPSDRAVIDCFDELPIKQIAQLLTAVGFSSPPSWIKPYTSLSRGEQFRCDLARALALGRAFQSQTSPLTPLVAFDEFTSVVDRNVARIASSALAKSIRNGAIPVRFIGVTCHYDILGWLQPDWMIDMARREFSHLADQPNGRSLRRPPIELHLYQTDRIMWQTFARHHYLSGNLHHSAQCFVARWHGAPVAFCATLPLPGRRNHWRITRIVTLPDYQGVGIGTRLMESVADLYRQRDCRVNVTASHPSLIAHCRRSPHWRLVRFAKAGTRLPQRSIGKRTASTLRATASFEYVKANPLSVAGEKIHFYPGNQGRYEHLSLKNTACRDSGAKVASLEIQNLSGKTSVPNPSTLFHGGLP